MQELICLCWKRCILLVERQMPQNMLIQTPEQKPPPFFFFFSLRLTLSCKLTAGQEIKPASHDCTPVCDSTQDLAAAWGFPLSPGTVGANRCRRLAGTRPKKNWDGSCCLSRKPMAVFNMGGTRRGSPPQWDSLCNALPGVHLSMPHRKQTRTPW